MRPFLRIAVLAGLFAVVVGITGYLTLRFIVRSEDVVIVPDLVGKDIVYALELLTDLGLNTKVSGHEYRADVPKNHVAYQEPKAGAEVKKDRDIRIIVSKGPEIVIVPNLEGADVRGAIITIEENGLTQGVVSEIYSEGKASGEVLSQVPAPGLVINRGDTIDLLVGLGRRPVRFQMPYLNGLSPEDAILILERSQLNLGQMRHIQRDDLPKGVVVEQNPRSGHPVVSGTSVNLTVNREEKVLISDRGLHLLHYPVSDGFLKKHIKLRINAFGFFYDLYDLFQPPGEDVWMLLPQGDEVAFFLYEDDELMFSYSFSSRSEFPTFRGE
jgi:serine/threonine-protein kinase